MFTSADYVFVSCVIHCRHQFKIKQKYCHLRRKSIVLLIHCPFIYPAYLDWEVYKRHRNIVFKCLLDYGYNKFKEPARRKRCIITLSQRTVHNSKCMLVCYVRYAKVICLKGLYNLR